MEKELKKCNRGELITMVMKLNQDMDALNETLKAHQEELKQKEAKIAELEKELADRSLAQEECGSIAEAAVQINGVLQAAQAAADQYLENIKQRQAEQDAILAQKKLEAEKYDLRTRAEADDYYRNKISQANVEAEQKWEQVTGRMEAFYQTHEGLKELLAEVGMLNK